MTSSIPQTPPSSAYERFVVTPLSKVARVAIAVFKFIAAIVTWPFKAIYRLFVPSEQKPKEQQGAASTGAVVSPAASTQAFELKLNQKGEQDFSTVLKELIESELRERPLVEKEELDLTKNDCKRCATLTTLKGLETQQYNKNQSQQFLDFLIASTNDNHLLRSTLYFYLSQSPVNSLIFGINDLLMVKGLRLMSPEKEDSQPHYKVESLDDKLKTETTWYLVIQKGENTIKNCVLSLKAIINRTTHAVDLKATIELKNPKLGPLFLLSSSFWF